MRASWPLVAGTVLLCLAAAASVLLLVSAPAGADQPSADSVSAAQGRLAARIPIDQLAVVIRMGTVAGLGGAARAGDRVDVFLFFSPQAAGGHSLTRVFLQDRPVYAVSHDADAQLLTLGLSPDQVLLAEQAFQLGAKPFVILRSAQGQLAPYTREALTDADVPRWVVAPRPGTDRAR